MKTLRELFARLPLEGNMRHLFRSFNLRMSAQDDIPSAKQLAMDLGFDVHLVDMSKRQRGKLVPDAFCSAGYRIEVNAKDSVETRRWTVLHELMHYYLHPHPDILADKHRANGSYFYDVAELREEKEANRAVETLVFGDGALEAAISLLGHDDIQKLARHFGVSEATLRIALKRFP